MNKRVLIISPYFPPSNTADMQRIRMSLPYFKQFGWDAEIVAVDQRFSETIKDELLMQSIPDHVKIHYVKAFDKKWTSKIGLGSLALRSMWFYRQKVNHILKRQKFDLVYFSTTQFPLCILGSYWKKHFKVPYIIDMQDPWHSDYYEGKPNEQKPRKYWFSYRLNKYLEPKAMKKVDGLIAVSEDYISILNGRYPQTKKVPASVITFGAYEKDFEIAKLNEHLFTELLHSDDINIVYIGRGGADIQPAIIALFNALKSGLADGIDSFRRLKFYFIGTSYAPAGQGNPTILPIAKQIGVEDQVIEITDRISYYQTLLTLLKSDALFLPGSDDPKYSASKMYPYLLTNKNLIAILNQNSPARSILEEYNVKHLYHYNDPELNTKINAFFNEVLNKRNENVYYNRKAIDKYSAENMTMHQCMVFAKVING